MPVLEKIVSGGQTGADRAALDTALKFNLPHGGWLPLGRKTEDGPLAAVYRLKEMETADYPSRTRQNILDSTGTVIISRGPLSGGSKLTRSFARVTGRPNCHIDLLTHDIFESAVILQSFILENRITVLNVAGPRASRDAGIYQDVKTILEAVLYMFFLEEDSWNEALPAFPALPAADPLPQTPAAALGVITADLGLKEKAWVARTKSPQMTPLYFSWLDPVKLRLGLDEDNARLLDALKKDALWEGYTPEDAVMDLLKALRERLAKTHELRLLP